MKTFTTLKDFFRYTNNYEGDIVFKKTKAYYKGELIAECIKENK